MINLLALAAQRAPEQPLVVSARGTVTYGATYAEVASLAAGLAGLSTPRVGAVVRRAEEVIALHAAGALAGVQVCGYPLEDATGELERLAGRLHHTLLIRGSGEDQVPARRAVDLASLRSSAPPPAAAPDPTMMILTTGTTGERRGAIHAWSRLAPPPGDSAPDERWLLAYNLSQFAGLAILLHVLAHGATLVQPDRQRAREGLAAITAHGVTHVSATPTFWRGLLRELGDASAPDLTQITLGGEAVPEALLGELRARFPRARVSQIYAATEFGQTGSVRDGRPGLPESVLHRGPDAPVQLRVIDGELHVRSRIGMLGYWGEPPLDPDAWRPTGDLVEIADGRLLFAGRISEVINVGGVKVHPRAVERVVEAVPGVHAVAAHGRANPLTGQIVALQVVLAERAVEDDVDDAIRSVCADLAPAARPRSIRYVDELATTGHKVHRRAM